MSYQATCWAKGIKTGSPAKKALLMVLAEHADQWGWTFAGQETLSEETEIGERQVRRLTAEIALAGLIEVWQARNSRGNLTNLYRLVFGAKPKDRMPDEHPSRNPRFKRVEYEPPPDNMSAGPSDNLTGGPTGQIEQSHRTSEAEPPDIAMSDKKVLTGHNLGARVDDGATADRTLPLLEGGAPASPEAFWEASRDKIEAAVGEDQYRSWLAILSPGAGPDNGIVLRAATPFIADHVAEHLCPKLTEALGRPVTAEVA